MISIRTSVSMIALFFVLFSVSTAQAGPFISAYQQTICIAGSGDGTSWDWELRPAGGGTPFCLGTESVTGTQAQLAETLDMGQGSVSKIENAADMYLSTLRRFVAALGGELIIKASFPEGREFVIDHLSEVLDERGEARAPKPVQAAF